MITHNLKTWPNIFEEMYKGNKSFDIRENDRNFQIGDQIILDEYDNINNTYTGRHLHAKITYIMKSPNPFVELKNKVILSLKYWV